jgi:hypothetical protein
MLENQPNTQEKLPEKSDSNKVDEKGSVVITGFVRISDPQTNKTIVETRA